MEREWLNGKWVNWAAGGAKRAVMATVDILDRKCWHDDGGGLSKLGSGPVERRCGRRKVDMVGGQAEARQK